ncbi:hypothetical protein VPH35_001403 [Triticum aestivum]
MGDESTSCTVVPLALDDPDHWHHCFPTSCLHRHLPVGLCRRSTLAVHSHHSRSFNATTPGRSLPAAPWIPPLTLGVSVIEKFNAATTGRSISPSWTCPFTSFWLLVIPVWPGRWVRRHCDQQSNPAAPGRSPSQLPGRLCRATFHLHLGLPYASPTPAGKYGGLQQVIFL